MSINNGAMQYGDPVHADLGDDVRIHRSSNDAETTYTTIDHSKRRAIHYTFIKVEPAGDRLPFEHEYQDVVEKVDHPKLGKGYATDLLYSHFLRSAHPLSTSNKQQLGGHKMWRNLAHTAFADGHHVYFWDNAKKTLSHLQTKEQVEHGLNSYFNQSKPGNSGHVIISKNPLT